jgi:hypothetical protein
MPEEQELKVVDRRSQSNDSGCKSSDSSLNSIKNAPLSENVPQQELAQGQDLDHEEQGPMDFASFMVGLATQAMMLLGEIPEPQSGQMLPPNLPAARQTIDIISMLQEKTTGNLSPDESKLIQDVLTSLRIEFVKKAKSK